MISLGFGNIASEIISLVFVFWGMSTALYRKFKNISYMLNLKVVSELTSLPSPPALISNITNGEDPSLSCLRWSLAVIVLSSSFS
jgi:hypothetical protein